jgi:hypothetical protein
MLALVESVEPSLVTLDFLRIGRLCNDLSLESAALFRQTPRGPETTRGGLGE